MTPSSTSATPMPELPEVETTRRHLVPVLEGAVIREVEVRRERMTRRQERPTDFADRLRGRRVHSLDRTGKLLVARLSGDISWVTHLGMSGRLSVNRRSDPEQPHTNVVVRLGRGREIRMVDPRTFGFVAALTPDEWQASFGRRLGPDALDALPTAPRLAAALRGRTAPIKALLLDQGFIAELGNIYADEALHRAGIRPERPAGSLSRDEVATLRRAVGTVLRAGLRHGGTSLDDLAYLLPDGRAGEYMVRLAVYGRAGERCRRCSTPIERSVIRGRSSFWCPGCQV